MKNMFKLLLILTIFTVTSCKNDVKTLLKERYSIDETSSDVKWTAYKKTEKVPVKGVFKTIRVKNKVSGTSPADALNGILFTIPVNSIDSQNKDRDSKLINTFFGSMDTKSLKGRITITDSKNGFVTLTMHGISSDFPITFEVHDLIIDIKAKIDLNNWKAQIAIDALNKVCEDLHKGKDGISKTWNEVDLQITVKTLKTKKN